MINQLQRWLNKSEFIKNSMTLITGTVIAQLVPILLQPILRRLYEPSDFGTLALYSTLLSVFVSLATLKYESTVMLPRKDDDAANLVFGSVLISFTFSILLFVLFLTCKNQIVSIMSLPEEMG